MKATAELQVIPLGQWVSVRKEIRRVVELLQSHDFILETHASGTNIEGELTDILVAVEQIHEDMERDRFFSAEEARDYGVIDHVMSDRDLRIPAGGSSNGSS